MDARALAVDPLLARVAPQPPAGARFSVNGKDRAKLSALASQRCETTSG